MPPRHPFNISTTFRRRGPELPRGRVHYKVRTRVSNLTAQTDTTLPGGDRQGYLGPLLHNYVPYITTGTRDDLFHAFDKRINYHTNRHATRHFENGARRFVKRLVPEQLPGFDWDIDDFHEWLDKFDTEKQNRMIKAYEEQGFNHIKQYSDKDVFTKIEALVKPFESVKGRVIFKGTDLYNMISGLIFNKLMTRLKQTEQSNKLAYNIQFAYKETTDDISRFLHDGPKGSYIEADFTANDKLQCKTVMTLELLLMKRLGAPAWFLRLHQATNKFRIRNGKFGLMAWVENMLPTGATDTTFRNSFWNLCIFNAWHTESRPGHAHVAVLGDDMLASTERWVRRGAGRYKRIAESARMSAKVSMKSRLEDCHFLSKHFYPSYAQQHPVMLPFLGKTLAKFNVRPNNNQQVSDDLYMAGKALSMCYEFRYCYLIRNMFAKRATLHLNRTGGRFSMEGVSWNVRESALQFEAHAEKVLEDAKAHLVCSSDGVGHDIDRRTANYAFPDLLTYSDLQEFWMRKTQLCIADLTPAMARVITTEDPVTLQAAALQLLLDY